MLPIFSSLCPRELLKIPAEQLSLYTFGAFNRTGKRGSEVRCHCFHLGK